LIKAALGRLRLAEPFDRMLVAQALTERAHLVSHDRSLEPYGVPMVWTQRGTYCR